MLLGTLGVSLIENLLDGNWINLDEYKLLQDNWIALNGNVNNAKSGGRKPYQRGNI